jgi:beta-lactamase regulating signal transducer with metallopeptidase domain/ankyrin repeat protein
MNLAAVLTAEPWMERLGWVLIHFVWQGAAIALLLAGALRLLAGRSSRSRYAACGLALVLCCTAPAMTWVVLSPAATADVQAVAPLRPAAASAIEVPVRERPDFQPASGAASTDGIEEPWQNRLLEEIDAISPYLVALWLMGVLVLATRMAWAWMLTRQLCRLGTPIRNEVLLLRWRDLLERMAIRLPVRLLESAQVDVPTLIGWLRPTILLPATVLTGLTPDQLEAVLAHELAHVRRFDYLFNLLQSLVETILFYHPAVWWIGRRMREERENCCDDVSLDVVQNRHVYASALALLEERRTTPLALTATGGSLLRRIRRIAGVDGRRASAAPLVTGLIVLAVLVVGLAWGPLLRAVAPDKFTLATSGLVDAIKAGNSAKVKEMLRQGADANAIDGRGDSVLQLAVQGDHLEIVKALLEKGADPNAPTAGWNLFFFARSAEVVRLLIQHGANLRPKLDDGNTLIESVTSYESGDNAAVINELIKDGAPFDPKSDGISALARAAAGNHVSTMQVLIDHGVDPNAYSANTRMQTTALHNAVGEPSSDAVKFLLERGVNPSGDPRDGSTPLAMAIEQARPKMRSFCAEPVLMT